jgi:predicted ArsR family transcriptional regulator
VQPDSDSPIQLTGPAEDRVERAPGVDTTQSDSHFSAAVTAVTAAFGDPTRREIYLFVRSNPGATASEVATRFSLHPNVARHHLERLATGGYVEVTMERAAGTGAGRPSKRFRVIGNDPTLDLLTRRDDLLVLLLQEALQLLGPSAAEGMAERVG